MDEKVRHMCGRSAGEMGSRNSWLQALESWNVPRCGIWVVSWRSFQPRALVGMFVGLVTWTYRVRREKISDVENGSKKTGKFWPKNGSKKTGEFKS